MRPNLGKSVGCEVADVVGDDRVGASPERRRNHMAIADVNLVRDGGCEAAGLVRHRIVLIWPPVCDDLRLLTTTCGDGERVDSQVDRVLDSWWG